MLFLHTEIGTKSTIKRIWLLIITYGREINVSRVLFSRPRTVTLPQIDLHGFDFFFHFNNVFEETFDSAQSLTRTYRLIKITYNNMLQLWSSCQHKISDMYILQ